MPTFTDLHILAEISGIRSKGSFSEFMERETGYTWDGTPEGKVSLMRVYSESRDTDTDSRITDLESRLLPVLAHMEHEGIEIDSEKLKNIGARIAKDIALKEKEIYEVTGEFFNINSPKQVADILFGKLGIKGGKKNKTGYSVDALVLEEIARDHAVARIILDYRSLSKLQSTYVEALLKAIDPLTGRVHTTYGQIGAATGRMNSNDPNLQNIPTGDGYAKEIKSCFVPKEDHVLIAGDYSQIELRVLAWLSGDPGLLDTFEKGEDIHTRTARFLFGEQKSVDSGQWTVESDSKPTSEQRRIAKTVNFGVIYGITGFGLAKTLGTSPWEAEKWIDAFYERYPRVRSYYDELLAKGRELGYVETAFGRRRYIPGLQDANKTIRSIAEREAINMPIQGTAADMIKYAMIDIDAKIRENGYTGKMLLQVHDELVFEVPKAERDIFSQMVKECMEEVLSHYTSLTREHSTGDTGSSLRVPPIRIDIHSGENWVEAKS